MEEREVEAKRFMEVIEKSLDGINSVITTQTDKTEEVNRA
jgi:hypothetical protein